MHITKEILGQKYNSQTMDDKVYWIAKRVKKDKEKKTLTIVVEKKFIVSHKQFPETSEIASLQKFRKETEGTLEEGLENVLVSSGSIIWNKENNNILVTQRSDDAMFDPGAWTTPAGRCEHTPFETGLRETAEEIEISKTETGEIIYPSICDEIVKGKYYKTEVGMPKDFETQLTEVVTKLNGEILETQKMWFWLDKNNNTLELRIPIIASLPKKISVTNPEYHTTAKFADTGWLKAQRTVGALREYTNALGLIND